MKVMKMFRDMQKYAKGSCKPTQLFLVVSAFALVSMMVQNMQGDRYNQLCVGNMSCRMSPVEKGILFGVQLVYIAVWAVILNSLCKNKYTNLAWAIVLLPFVLVALGLVQVLRVRAL
jgi:hypothetical protein